MTDEEIRHLVRAAIARHLGGEAQPPAPPAPAPSTPMAFARYHIPRGQDDMCVIEPAVRCNHCGYCQCHGH